MKKLLALHAMLISVAISQGQVASPGGVLQGKALIRYATAHIGDGRVIDNALIEIQNGEINRVVDAATTRVTESEYDTIINADGLHAYPGMIAMDSRLGLVEIDAVKATRDFQETGKWLPMVRALPAYNAESKIIPTVRANGVLIAQIAPVGARISGSSSVVNLDAWNWRDAVLTRDEGVFMNWPSRYKYKGWWAEQGPAAANKKYLDERQELYQYFAEAKAYAAMPHPDPINLGFEAMRGLFDGKKTLYIRANWARDILDAIKLARKFGISRFAIVGAAEAHLCATQLRESGATVVLTRVHRLPDHPDEPITLPFELPRILNDSGVSFCFSMAGSMEAMLTRNLPFEVGTAVHYGLPYEKAVSALTLVPARLLQIDNKYGTLEAGKSATLFLSEGDPLSISGNKVKLALIDGRVASLESHQEILYEKFSTGRELRE
ncbi:MAG: amidohydrolase family protein [Salibacteraceae bacterium]